MSSISESNPSGPWWRQLNRYHWFVFAMASLAWMFDCLDQQLFILARNSAIAALSPKGTDPALIKTAGANATAIFVAGWAMGGLIFGALGDRIGRAKTLTLTVLMYSLFTGLIGIRLSRFRNGLHRRCTCESRVRYNCRIRRKRRYICLSRGSWIVVDGCRSGGLTCVCICHFRRLR